MNLISWYLRERMKSYREIAARLSVYKMKRGALVGGDRKRTSTLY